MSNTTQQSPPITPVSTAQQSQPSIAERMKKIFDRLQDELREKQLEIDRLQRELDRRTDKSAVDDESEPDEPSQLDESQTCGHGGMASGDEEHPPASCPRPAARRTQAGRSTAKPCPFCRREIAVPGALRRATGHPTGREAGEARHVGGPPPDLRRGVAATTRRGCGARSREPCQATSSNQVRGGGFP